MLSNKDIERIHNKFVRINNTLAYMNKYVPLPLHLNDQEWKWEKKDFPRVIALLEFREMMKEKAFDSVLTFGSIDSAGVYDPELRYLKYNDHTDLNYDNNPEWDLHSFDLDKKDYDFVMINQVIEHLYDPIRALKNIYNHTKPGGMFYTNVPVNNIPHSTPYHYYTGVTPVGLGVMVSLAGFEIVKIGQWGNKEYLKQSYDHIWSDYTYSNTPGHNDFDCPIITWCLAIKPKDDE